MHIIHHFGIRIDSDQQRSEFAEAGIELPDGAALPGGGSMTGFEIAEDDPRWTEVADIAHRFRAIETVSTKFSDTELNAARFLGIVARAHRGYPEPSEKKGFLRTSFDVSGYCHRCGLGRKQVAPFRLRGALAPKRSILQLNWIFDEYFVSPEVWESVFNPAGIGYRPVVLNETGSELKSIVQLDIAHSCAVNVRNLHSDNCPTCSRPKYQPTLKGFFPEPLSDESDMFKSKEFFGSGMGAWHLVFISNRFYRRIMHEGLTGLDFYPCAG